MNLYIYIYIYDFPTTFMSRVSVSSAPECVIAVLLESSFSDPARHKIIIVVIVIPCFSLKTVRLYFRFLFQSYSFSF